MMETAMAMRGYTVNQVKPLLEPMLEETFLPQSVPAPPAISLDEDERARVTSLLADRIGPVAAALLKKEMKQAKSLTDLTAKLARAIPDETERRVFFEAMGNISWPSQPSRQHHHFFNSAPCNLSPPRNNGEFQEDEHPIPQFSDFFPR